MEEFKSQEVKALIARIRTLFQEHDDQGKVIIALYRMVFPDWDRIKSIQDHPETGDSLWKFICREFQKFDQEHQPDCLPGGAWMNLGFSVNRKFGPWEINSENCSITYQP